MFMYADKKYFLSAPINFWSLTEICLNFILDPLNFIIGKEKCANVYYLPYIPYRFLQLWRGGAQFHGNYKCN
jgi:hypothetical protein